MSAIDPISAAAIASCSQRDAGNANNAASTSASARRAMQTSPKRVPLSTDQAPPCRQTLTSDAPKMSEASQMSQIAPDPAATSRPPQTSQRLAALKRIPYAGRRGSEREDAERHRPRGERGCGEVHGAHEDKWIDHTRERSRADAEGEVALRAMGVDR